jgi:uncharacterized membrane protein YhaH (DUF805 family)
VAAFIRFITWRTRLNRMQFGVGYLALAGGGALFMNVVVFIIAGIVGIEVVFNNLHWMAPAFLLLIPPLFGLIAGRAHDLGVPAWPFVGLYLLPWPAWAVLMDSGMGYFGGALAGFAEHIPFAAITAAMFGPAILIFVMLITFASLPGQKHANRYGDAPAPGLFSDLPRSRA